MCIRDSIWSPCSSCILHIKMFIHACCYVDQYCKFSQSLQPTIVCVCFIMVDSISCDIEISGILQVCSQQEVLWPLLLWFVHWFSLWLVCWLELSVVTGLLSIDSGFCNNQTPSMVNPPHQLFQFQSMMILCHQNSSQRRKTLNLRKMLLMEIDKPSFHIKYHNMRIYLQQHYKL